MARLGIKDGFAHYGAKQRNVQWSVSAWTPNGELVVCLWSSHFRKGPSGTMECTDKVSRWRGPGRDEFARNVQHALDKGSPVRLIVATTPNTEHVESGLSASDVPKEFAVRDDVVGKVVEFDGDRYLFRFEKT